MEEDEVLREIPVYLNKTLDGNLHLVQFPCRPCAVNLQHETVTEAKLKPDSKMLQLTLEVDTESDCYDQLKGENMGIQALGLTDNEYIPEPVPKLNKQILEGSPISKLGKFSSYAVGFMKEEELCLTPLHSIIQMKPTFPYLDKARNDKGGTQSIDTEEEDDEEEEVTKVTVKFKRDAKDSKPSDKNKKSSVVTKKIQDQEPWQNLEFIRNDPVEIKKLFVRSAQNESNPFYVLPPDSYLTGLFPKFKESEIKSSKLNKKSGNYRISVNDLKQLPMQDQLRILLLNGKVLRYKQIAEFLKLKLHTEFDDSSLLKCVQTVATLVQGCWVVRSDIVYGDDFVSGANGIPGPVMQKARDLTLAQFTDVQAVERRKISTLTKLPPEEVTEILCSMSKLVPKKGWEFLLPFDSDFVKEYPSVVERQRLIWEVMKSQQQRSSKSVDEQEADDESKEKYSMSPPSRRKSRAKSFSSDNESGSESESKSRKSAGNQRPRKNSFSSSSSRDKQCSVPTFSSKLDT